jgi:hypothetical protein
MIFDARKTPILITSRDRLTPLVALIAWLERAGHERIVMVDNDSSFGPLLDYYERTPHQVIKLGSNLGHLSVWDGDVLNTIGHDREFVVTDSDVIPDENCPLDAVAHFADLLFRHSDIDKAGFGLRIDDIPVTYKFHDDVIEWESQFWEQEIEPGVYRANIDTTFALYRPSTPRGTFRAVRSGPPYVARHMGWYSDSLHPTEEESYYRAHARLGVSNWDAEVLPDELNEAIGARRAQRLTASTPPGPPDAASPSPRPGVSGWRRRSPPFAPLVRTGGSPRCAGFVPPVGAYAVLNEL